MNGLSRLSFAALRAANIMRIPLFTDRHGKPCHSQPDGSDWSKGEWCNAVTGELGELANLIKKVQRGDFTMEEARPNIAKELADVQVYLDILAFQCGVDLGKATQEKFNEVSRRVGCDVVLESPLPAGWARVVATRDEQGKYKVGVAFRAAQKGDPEYPPEDGGGPWIALYQ
jgi:NTP pyrophosphatase (non-canonical NTP hydrolase)